MFLVVVAALCAVGVCSLLWMVFGSMLMPVGGQETLEIAIFAQGDGEELEQTLRGLFWLESAGLLKGTLRIVDQGLTPKGCAEAEYLCARRFDSVKFSRCFGQQST